MAKYCGKDLLIQRAFTAAAWVTLTAYVVGDYVTAGLNTYRCKTAGTSGATGPTGTTSPQTDGSVVWEFVGVTGTLNGYVTIAGMRSTSLKINNEQVDVTDKGDIPWRQLLACGIRSMELSASGIFSNAVALTEIMADVVGGGIVDFKVISGRGDMFVGAYLVASCERNGEYNGAEQYSLTLASAGAIAYTPAP
jgi:TP901-1 family phage major tail protein